jgi:hypothetical protein
LLEEIAEDRTTGPELLELFPGRTIAAIRKRLFDMRRSLGLTGSRSSSSTSESAPRMLDPEDPGLVDHWLPQWTERAAASNQQFLAALQAAA